MSSTVHIPVDEAGPTVNDVMMRGAETRRARDAARGGPRRSSAPRKKLLLVTDGERFLGTLTPADVPDDRDGPIEPHVRADTPRVAPERPGRGGAGARRDEGMTRIPSWTPSDRLAGAGLLQRSHEAFCIYPS